MRMASHNRRINEASFYGRTPIRFEDTVWEDLKVSPGELQLGPSAPSTINFLGTYPIYSFDQGEELTFFAQLPHGYKVGDDVTVHIHWTPHSRGVLEDGNTVNWRVDISPALVDGVFNSTDTYNLTATCSGVDNMHQIIGADAVIPGASLGISAGFFGRVYRAAGDSWSSNLAANRPALVEVDFHVPYDGLGSEEIFSKISY